MSVAFARASASTSRRPTATEFAALNDAGSLVAVVRRRGETVQPVVVLPADVASARE